MRWLVGIDLQERCRGALNFCAFVSRHSRAADGDRLEAVHVLEDRELRPVQAHVSLAEIERMAHAGLEAEVRRAGVDLARAELAFDATAERALARRVAAQPDTVLVLGRKADRSGRGFVRLGRTARRLVRTLPGPLVVVPSDLPADLPPGPVMLATGLGDDSDGAAELAARLARRWDRRVLAVHIVPGIPDAPPYFVPAATRHQLLAQMRQDGDAGLTVWLRRHQLADADAVVAAGDVVERLCGIAEQEQAVIIVVGSRRLSLGARMYTSSIGSDLAGTAPVPVAVVPPP